MIDKFERHVCISGIGMSDVGRRLMRDPTSLVIDAAKAAVADAGLTMADIDGLACHPGVHREAGYSGPGVLDLEYILRIHPKWFSSGMEVPGHGGALVNAALAVAGGLCRHVLVFRSTWEATYAALAKEGKVPPLRGNPRLSGYLEWLAPFGAFSAANWIGTCANRHFTEYGTTREQLGQIALNARKNAMLNDAAIYRDPLTMDDYLSARMISTPFGLYDCDTPCDGAVAFIVSHIDTRRDLRRPDPVRFEAVGCQITEIPSWDQSTLTHEVLVEGPARSLWERTDLKPSDVRVAELYDGFTFNCLSWIELLGFCPVGEGGRFIEGGQRIALDGELPLNTHGGQLSAGRLQGFSFIHEACVQLWGEGGARQVPGNPQVAVASSGGGAPGGVFLFTRE